MNEAVKYHTYLERLWNTLSEFTEDTILGSVKKSIKKQKTRSEKIKRWDFWRNKLSTYGLKIIQNADTLSGKKEAQQTAQGEKTYTWWPNQTEFPSIKASLKYTHKTSLLHCF